jgi:hypothetical protein
MAVDLNDDMYDREIHASPYETYQRLVRDAPSYFFSLPTAVTLQMPLRSRSINTSRRRSLRGCSSTKPGQARI